MSELKENVRIMSEKLDEKKIIEDEKEKIINIIVPMAQGNPGALKVIMRIFESDPMFLNPFSIAFFMTKSSSPFIWSIYKDICKCDLDKTKEVLTSWFDNSTLSLDEWYKAQNFENGRPC